MAGDGELLERLHGGDEEAFTELVSRYHPSMVRLAAAYVPDRALAKEVRGVPGWACWRSPAV